MSIKVFLKYLTFLYLFIRYLLKIISFHYVLYFFRDNLTQCEYISTALNDNNKANSLLRFFYLCIDHKTYLGIVTSMFTRMKRARVTPCTTAAALNWSLMKNKINIKITHLHWCLWSDKQACESLNNVLNLNLLIEN